MKCRFCGEELNHSFIDLISSPPSNSFLKQEQLNQPEIYYPLKVFVCENCKLVQIDEYKNCEDIFCDDYVYFSSMSKTWLEHSKKYVKMITSSLGLNGASLVTEIASNDGYLLQYFKERLIPCYGIEPTACTANVARKKGIEVVEDFFGVRLAEKLRIEGRAADLVLGNNVLAHVPDINDFVEGLIIILKPQGTVTMEFPHLLRLIENNQFDTIYHEHFSYLSLGTVVKIFQTHGLEIFDVEELPTHGGSLRIYAQHEKIGKQKISERLTAVLELEKKAGMDNLEYYAAFKDKVEKVKFDFIDFIVKEKSAGRRIAAYGAAAKGNTLLNFCGIKKDVIDFVVDAAPSKQGRYLPGSHIPVVKEEVLKIMKPDYVVIFPWNIKEEIMNQLNYIKAWGGKFVVAVPQLNVM